MSAYHEINGRGALRYGRCRGACPWTGRTLSAWSTIRTVRSSYAIGACGTLRTLSADNTISTRGTLSADFWLR